MRVVARAAPRHHGVGPESLCRTGGSVRILLLAEQGTLLAGGFGQWASNMMAPWVHASLRCRTGIIPCPDASRIALQINFKAESSSG